MLETGSWVGSWSCLEEWILFRAPPDLSGLSVGRFPSRKKRGKDNDARNPDLCRHWMKWNTPERLGGETLAVPLVKQKKKFVKGN